MEHNLYLALYIEIAISASEETLYFDPLVKCSETLYFDSLVNM